MKATDEQEKLFISNWTTKTGNIKDALQAVFDTMTEPTPEQIERAVIAYKDFNGGESNAMRAALKAAMTEPPPVKYPHAKKFIAGYVLIYLNATTPTHIISVPSCMEFDFETLTMSLKK